MTLKLRKNQSKTQSQLLLLPKRQVKRKMMKKLKRKRKRKRNEKGQSNQATPKQRMRKKRQSYQPKHSRRLGSERSSENNSNRQGSVESTLMRQMKKFSLDIKRRFLISHKKSYLKTSDIKSWYTRGQRSQIRN